MDGYDRIHYDTQLQAQKFWDHSQITKYFKCELRIVHFILWCYVRSEANRNFFKRSATGRSLGYHAGKTRLTAAQHMATDDCPCRTSGVYIVNQGFKRRKLPWLSHVCRLPTRHNAKNHTTSTATVEGGCIRRRLCKWLRNNIYQLSHLCLTLIWFPGSDRPILESPLGTWALSE